MSQKNAYTSKSWHLLQGAVYCIFHNTKMFFFQNMDDNINFLQTLSPNRTVSTEQNDYINFPTIWYLIQRIKIIQRTYYLSYIWHEMVNSSRNVLLNLSDITSKTVPISLIIFIYFQRNQILRIVADKGVELAAEFLCKFFYRLLIKIIEFYFLLFYYCLMTSGGGNVT